MVAQRLVAADRVGVMVAVPLQVVEEDVRGDVVRVPGVLGTAELVAVLLRVPLPQQAVVLEVVDDLEQREPDHRLDDEPRQDRPAESGNERGVEHDGHRPGVEDVVMDRPERLAEAVEPGPLELDRRPQGPDHGPRQELPEALAEPRARGVLGGGDADVMAAVVLDEEMAVAGLGERHLRQPALVALALVAELVGGVDRDPADHRDADREPERLGERELAARPERAREDQRRELQGQEHVRAPAVVAVLLEPLDGAVGRVGGVLADQQVEGGDDREDEHRAEPVEGAEPGRGGEPGGHERDQRDDQAEQPQVALRIGPGRRDRGCDGRGFHCSCSSSCLTMMVFVSSSFTQSQCLSNEDGARGGGSAGSPPPSGPRPFSIGSTRRVTRTKKTSATAPIQIAGSFGASDSSRLPR